MLARRRFGIGTPLPACTVLLVFVMCGCTDDARAPVAAADSWPEADALFHADPDWLGGDGALSVPLGGERVLWLFGDSFVATSAARARTESEMIRNTVAIQQGLDPRSASMTFAWRTDPDDSPAPFFADMGDRWFWPGHGVRLPEGPLVLFLEAVRATPGAGLGFTEAGFVAVRIDNPDDPPLSWELTWLEPPTLGADPSVSLGIAALHEGEHVYAMATAGGSRHVGWLARLRTRDLIAGTLDPEWWAGTAAGWLTAAALGDRAPATVIDDIGSECSVHRDDRLDRYVHVASRGFGASTIAMRTAERLTGPWTEAADVFTPPESRGSRPFVYAGKAHPELTTDDASDLVVTYATNSFEFRDLFTPAGQALYWPRFVRLRLEIPAP